LSDPTSTQICVRPLTCTPAAADNFDPEYLKINPNGTVPSLVAPSLPAPLTQSTDILRHVDSLRNNSTLVPQDPETRRKAQAIIDLVHSEDVNTNLILFQARDDDEMRAKKASPWNDFLASRQRRLEQEKAKDPAHAFYGPKSVENGAVTKLYQSEIGDEHRRFYQDTHAMYCTFAAGFDRVEQSLALPFAAGDGITEADFHVAPWLAHAMWGAGTVPTDVQDFSVLEALVQKSVPEFTVGPKVRAWWANMAETRAFQKVFAVLH
jgi:glutathione S-transferase